MEIEKKQKIAALIPCLNEGITIKKVITDLKTYIPEADIYVYDNGSEDQTFKEASDAGAYVHIFSRKGKGNVIRKMFRDIDADIYIMIDGDDTYDLTEIRRMIDLIKDNSADMVIGDRLSSNYFSQNKRLMHNSGNRLIRNLINRLFKSNINDVLSGLRVMNRNFVKNLPILTSGFEIESEMTIHALDNNFMIKEIPVCYRERHHGSTSKLNTISDGIRVIRLIALLFCDYRPFSFFSFISVIVALSGIIFLYPILIEYFKTGLVPRFPTLIVSTLLFTISLLLFLAGVILTVIYRHHKRNYELQLTHWNSIRQ